MSQLLCDIKFIIKMTYINGKSILQFSYIFFSLLLDSPFAFILKGQLLLTS